MPDDRHVVSRDIQQSRVPDVSSRRGAEIAVVGLSLISGRISAIAYAAFCQGAFLSRCSGFSAGVVPVLSNPGVRRNRSSISFASRRSDLRAGATIPPSTQIKPPAAVISPLSANARITSDPTSPSSAGGRLGRCCSTPGPQLGIFLRQAVRAQIGGIGHASWNDRHRVTLACRVKVREIRLEAIEFCNLR